MADELETSEKSLPRSSSLKPREKSSRAKSEETKEEDVEDAGEDGGDGMMKALSKITGQAKALKFAMDLAKKAYDARDDLMFDEDEEQEEELDEEPEHGKVRLTPAEKEEQELMDLFTNLEPPVFKPAPLHVRGLCQAAKRQCTRQKQKEEERLQVVEQLRSDERPSDLNLEVKTCLNDEELKDLESTWRRLQYNVALLQRRQERLAKIDNKTFQQLPEQIIEAGADGDYEFIRLCVEASVPLDTFNARGVTALITATVNNKVSSAKLLLESGADPSMQDLNGANCVHYAVGLRRLQILDMALETVNRTRNFMALYVKDARGKSVLDYVRSEGHEESLRLLKLRLGGPLGFVWAVTEGMVHSAIKLPTGEKSRRGMARAVARMAAERAAANIQEKVKLAKEKAREKLLGGWLCSYCSVATISKKKMEETIQTEVPDGNKHCHNKGDGGRGRRHDSRPTADSNHYCFLNGTGHCRLLQGI